MRASCPRQPPVHHALNRRAGRMRDDQMPGRTLVQRGIESLTLHGTDQRDRGHRRESLPASPATTLTGGHDRLHGSGGFAVPAYPAKPERHVPRPNSAPARYLSRPAWLRIAVMRPRHRRAALQHLTDAVTSGRQPTPSRRGSLRCMRPSGWPPRCSARPRNTTGQRPHSAWRPSRTTRYVCLS
jgi:hypothetical protein